MRATARFWVVLVVCLAWAHCLALPVAAQNTVVRLWPAQASTAVGQVVELAVQVNDVVGLVGLDVRLAWDPALLALEDADEQAQGAQALAGDMPMPDYVVRNFGDNLAGTLRYAVSQTGDTPPAAGSGTAVTLRFRALAPGVCPVTLVDAKLVDAQGNAIQAERFEAVLQIGGDQQATPAPTATPGPDGYPGPAVQPSATASQVATLTFVEPSPTSTASITVTATATSVGSTPSVVPLVPAEEATAPEVPAAPAQPAETPADEVVRATTPMLTATPPVSTPLYPFIPSEWFVCLGIGLLLGTLALFLYLSRRGQFEPERRPRPRLR